MPSSKVVVATWLCAAAALLPSSADAAADARLVSIDAAEPIEHPVIGLQRTAVPIAGGFALDTSLIADILLAPNLGVRWGMAFGPHRVVVGGRYAHFVGSEIYTQLIHDHQPAVVLFAPTFSGPSVYALYGVQLGGVVLQVEGKYSHYAYDDLSITGGITVSLSEAWSIVGEIGGRVMGVPTLRAALGVRLAGEHFGFTLGAVYVGIDDPLLPSIPVVPGLDLSWSFS